jgi:hypothetical protein
MSLDCLPGSDGTLPSHPTPYPFKAQWLLYGVYATFSNILKLCILVTSVLGVSVWSAQQSGYSPEER